jgi:hypothetical protein
MASPQDDSLSGTDGTTVAGTLTSKVPHALNRSSEHAKRLGMAAGGFMGLMLDATYKGIGIGLGDHEVHFLGRVRLHLGRVLCTSMLA